MMSNGLLIIDSQQSIKNYQQKSNLIFNNRFSLVKASKIALSSIDIVTDLDTISRLNSTAYIETSTQSFAVTVAVGKYNYIELAVAITVALTNTGLGAFGAAYTGSSYYISAPVGIKFINGPDSHSDWADMIGMDKQGQLTTTLSSVGVVDISYTRAIYVCSDVLHSYKKMLDSTTNNVNNILGIVYINKDANLGNDKDTSAPETNNAHHSTPDIHNLKWIDLQESQDLQQIDIKLYDDSGFLLEGSKFSYVLSILII